MANQIKAPINYPIIAGGKIVSGGSVIFGQPNVKPDPDNPSTLKAVYLDAALTQQAENPQGISSDGVFDQSDAGILYGPENTVYSIVILGANKKQLSYIPEYDLSDANAAATAQSAAAQAESAASNVIVAKDLTENLYTDFVNRYFGAYSSEPSVDPEGNPPSEGSIYFNTVSDVFFTWNGSAWVNYFPSNPNGLMVTATGTTTPRTLGDRFADVVNVKDFGAVGDGVTDDIVSFNSAAAQDVGTVNIKGADYLLSGNTTGGPANRVKIEGKPNIQGGVLSGYGIVDQSIINKSHSVESVLANSAGGEYGKFLSMTKTDPAPTSNSETDTLISIATVSTPSDSYDIDVVGVGARGYIAASNSNGRAWGLNAYARISNGGDGLLHAIEANVENKGTDNPTPDTPKAKYGINITTKPNSGTGTAALKFGSNSRWHYGLWAAQSAFEAITSKFIALSGLFGVDAMGRLAVGTDETAEQLRVYRDVGRSQIKVESDGGTEASIKYTKSGVRNWTFGHDTTTNTMKLTDGEGVTSGTTFLEIVANGNFGFNQTAYGNGEGVLSIGDAAVIPTSSPAGGGIIYIEAGALKYRGSSGTVTTLAPA